MREPIANAKQVKELIELHSASVRPHWLKYCRAKAKSIANFGRFLVFGIIRFV